MPRQTEIRCGNRYLGFVTLFNKVLFWYLELFSSFIDYIEENQSLALRHNTVGYIVIMSLICNKQKLNLYTGHEKVKGRAAQRASYHLHNNNHNTVRRSAHAHNTTQPVSTPAIYYASSQ